MGKRKAREIEDEEITQNIIEKKKVFEYDDSDEEITNENDDNEEEDDEIEEENEEDGEEEEDDDEEGSDEDSEEEDDEEEDKKSEENGWKHGGYHILPIKDETTGLYRYLYFKKHQSHTSEGKTIFITNIPPSISLAEVLSIFSYFGNIKEVTSGFINPSPLPSVSSVSETPKKNYLNYNSNANVGFSTPIDFDLSLRKINQIDPSKALFSQPNNNFGQKKPRRKKAMQNNNNTNNNNENNNINIHNNNNNNNNNNNDKNSIFDAENKKKKLRKDPKFTKGHFIHLTFYLMKSVNKLMSSDKSSFFSLNFTYNKLNNPNEESPSDSNSFIGLKSWLRDYEEKRNLQREKMQKEFDDFMLLFDRKKIAENKELEKKRNLVDEDGFILVQPRKKRQTDGEIQVSGVKVGKVIAEMNSADKKKKKDKVLTNFYKFQRQDTRVKKLDELKRKFEEDKKRIQNLKANRHFKPF